MKTASTLLLAAALVRGVCSRRVLQDIPLVGLGPTRSPTSSTSQAEAESSSPGIDEDDEEEFIDALEADDQVTVVSEIELGELLCDNLANAEDAATLSFVLLENERVIAEQTSYTVADGETFSDGIGRKGTRRTSVLVAMRMENGRVWTGVVTDPAQTEDEAVPRTISMTWGDICDTETFLLKVTRRKIDDTTSIVKTVPCFGSNTDTCLVEVEVEFEESEDGILLGDDDIFQSSSGTATRGTSSSSGGGSASTTSTPGSTGRRLQTDTVIDVMVLYSVSALTTLGGITPQQMETVILESLVGTNEAMMNSGVSAYVNPVHIGQLPYEVTTPDSASTLLDFQTNENVGILRDLVGADLVQLISDFDNSCGRGFLFRDDEALGYSIVQATCIDNYSHTHELGHNLGCNHNREDTGVDHEYAHAFRYCDGEDPYRTIMSYTCGTPRVNLFSNPDIIHLNKPTGTLMDDNARVIEDNMVAVSNYRNPGDPVSPAPSTAPPTTAPAITTPPTPAPNSVAPTTAPPTTAPPTPGSSTAPPTTAPPMSGSTTYALVGCYGDSSRGRVLTGRSVKSDPTMTTEACAEFCGGSRYFGTEFGQECFCGVAADDPARLGDARCTIPCTGDATQVCGGFNAISVYEFDDTVETEPENLGCWRDVQSNRIMDVVQSDSSMTNELCGEICSSYAFYGTQYGRECWCGDESTDYTRHGESTSCNRNCAGDANTICGGFNAMSVWRNP